MIMICHISPSPPLLPMPIPPQEVADGTGLPYLPPTHPMPIPPQEVADGTGQPYSISTRQRLYSQSAVCILLTLTDVF